MRRYSRLWIVLLVLAAIGLRLVTVYTMSGDPSRAEHVSRRVVHPADIRLSHARVSRDRVTHLHAITPSALDRIVADGLRNPSPVRHTPRGASSYPPYWGSLHLTI
ncbi:MAG: hypothetical protein ABI634_04020 [Acidobacteriota bacterium]